MATPTDDVRYGAHNGLNPDIVLCPFRAMSGSRVYFVCVVPWITNYETRGSLIRNDAPP